MADKSTSDEFKSFITEFAREAKCFGRSSLPNECTGKEADIKSSISMEEVTQPNTQSPLTSYFDELDATTAHQPSCTTASPPSSTLTPSPNATAAATLKPPKVLYGPCPARSTHSHFVCEICNKTDQEYRRERLEQSRLIYSKHSINFARASKEIITPTTAKASASMMSTTTTQATPPLFVERTSSLSSTTAISPTATSRTTTPMRRPSLLPRTVPSKVAAATHPCKKPASGGVSHPPITMLNNQRRNNAVGGLTLERRRNSLSMSTTTTLHSRTAVQRRSTMTPLSARRSIATSFAAAAPAASSSSTSFVPHRGPLPKFIDTTKMPLDQSVRVRSRISSLSANEESPSVTLFKNLRPRDLPNDNNYNRKKNPGI